MKKLCIIAFLFPFVGYSQPLNIKKTQSGIFSAGMRTTVSTFNGGELGNTGTGLGGQFTIQLSDRINTSWYSDYIRGSSNELSTRTDYHIGWRVMYYFTSKPSPKVKPFIIAAHCFDYTEIKENSNRSNSITRGSAAIQAGGGLHFNLTERMDLTFVSQYMIHLGEDIHAEVEHGVVHYEKHKGAGLEGHLLFHLGINYKIADLW